MTHNIKHLYAIGDSFAAGEGLAAFLPSRSDCAYVSKELQESVFSGIIAKNLSINTYTNFAKRGSSNDRTHRVLTHYIATTTDQLSETFMVINITHSARREVFSNKHNMYCQLITNWAPAEKGTPLYNYWATYAAHFDNVIENVDRYLLQIINIQALLEKYGIRYIMVNSMTENSEFYRALGLNASAIALINRKTYPDIESFLSWSGNRGFANTPCGHVYEDAHAAWAEYITSYIRDNNLLGE